MNKAHRMYTRGNLNLDWSRCDGIALLCKLIGVEDMPEVYSAFTTGATCKKGEVPDTATFYACEHDRKPFAVWTMETGLVLS